MGGGGAWFGSGEVSVSLPPLPPPSSDLAVVFFKVGERLAELGAGRDVRDGAAGASLGREEEGGVVGARPPAAPSTAHARVSHRGTERGGRRPLLPPQIPPPSLTLAPW